jgi:two-component system, sporulation sensor kinase E
MVAKDDLSIIAVNEATAALYGYTIDELLQMNIKKIRPVEDLEELTKSYKLGINEPTNFGVVKHIKKDGGTIFVNIISQDIVFENRLARLSSIINVTDRIKAEELLKKSEANLKTIMDATDVGYALLDRDLNIMAQNNAASGFASILFNKVPEKGDHIANYFPVNRFPQFKKYTEEVFNGIDIKYEISHLQAEGSLLWYNIRLFPIANNQNEIFGLLVALTDITNRKKSGERPGYVKCRT